ncbi:CoA transferase [Mesorhizobium sp.]|nr:CoA transferase [Mesorhizobium sp.]
MVAGIYGASAVAIALYARREGRARGQVIDLSLLESIFSTLGPEIAAYERTGKVKQRVGSGSNTSAPRNIYRCGNGKYLALSGSIQAMAERVFRTIGRDDRVCDPRFATNAARVRNRPLLDGILGEWFGARTREEALDIMHAADVTAGPVYDIADIAIDGHFRERGVFIELPDHELGSTLLNNAVPRLDDTPASFRIPAPELGEHTDLLLSELGFSVSEAEGLRERGVVK